MIYLLEEKHQLKYLLNSGFDECYLEVIPHYTNRHPINNSICAVYCKPFVGSNVKNNKGYIIPIKHMDTSNNIDTNGINTLIRKFNKVWVKNKKETLHYFSFYNITQIPYTDIQNTQPIQQNFEYRLKDQPINYMVPITKLYEECELNFEDIKDNIKPLDTYGQFLSDKTSLVFWGIEKSGLKVDKQKFEGYFHPIEENKVYTQYNLHTMTSRPSNKFNGVNYAALNKENGCRESFIPSNNKLVEIDVSAYHPNLICKLIGYKPPTQDIHAHFAELYGVEYKASKELTFKQLYGGVFKEYEHIEFFKRVKEYIDLLWIHFNEKGYIEETISGKRFLKDEVENPNKQKLFNYLLQATETSTNVLALWNILSILKPYNTKLVLYTYDSILIDLDESEEGVLEKINEVFKEYGLLTKMKEGYNYGF